MLETAAGRVTAALTAVLLLMVAVGLAVLWPHDEEVAAGPLVGGQMQTAEAVRVTNGSCENWGGPGCKLLDIQLGDGEHSGIGRTSRSRATTGRHPFTRAIGSRCCATLRPGSIRRSPTACRSTIRLSSRSRSSTSTAPRRC